MFRKFLVFVASSSFSLLLLLTVSLTAIVITFTPANIKLWLRSSKVYDTLIGNLIDQSVTLNKDPTNRDNNQVILDLAKKSITPLFLQTSTEKIIDGTSPWLEGKTAKPNFLIDLAPIKTSFADSVGGYAVTRYAGLPDCLAGQATVNTDILNISCKVKGYNPSADIQKTVSDLKTGSDFLPTTVLTPDSFNLTPNPSAPSKPFYETYYRAPMVYQSIQMAPVVFALLSLVSALTIIFLSLDRRKGIRRVAVGLGLTGLVLLISVYLGNLGITKAEQSFAKTSDIGRGLQSTILAIIKLIQQDTNRVVIYFAVAFLIIAGVKIIYLILTQKPSITANETVPPATAENDNLTKDSHDRPQDS